MILGVTLVSVPWGCLVCGLLCLALLSQAAKLLDVLWLRPRRLERKLRAQGLRGTPYRFPVGDIKDYGRLSKEAWSRPLPLGCHDIAPFLYNTIQEHGKTCFSWFGPVPKVTISDPDLAKEVMSNKFGHFEKTFPALSKLLAEGLASMEGDKWAKHRRILNPVKNCRRTAEELVVSHITTSSYPEEANGCASEKKWRKLPM